MARAIAAAESYQVASTRNMNAPAVAVEEGYAQAILDAGLNSGSGGPDIAADRCTWVVKVTAPFQPDYAPYPTAPRINPRYTVLFDVASGVMETLTSPPS